MDQSKALLASPGAIFWFPVHRRRGFIANVARALLEREGEKRLKRWPLERSPLETDFFLAEIADRTLIELEMTSFRSGVETESAHKPSKSRFGADAMEPRSAIKRGTARGRGRDPPRSIGVSGSSARPD